MTNLLLPNKVSPVMTDDEFLTFLLQHKRRILRWIEDGIYDKVGLTVGGGEIPLNSYIAEYHSIVLPTAKQRIGRWEIFDGLSASASAGAANQERYRISSSHAGATAFTMDTITGKTYLLTGSATTVLASNSLFIGDGTVNFKMRAAENPWMKFLLSLDTAPVGGTQEAVAGLWNDVGSLDATMDDGIYFSSTNGGNWFLVCKNTTTTSVDLGVAPSSTLILLEFRVSNDGGKVQAYYNGVAVGAAITTNIPTGLLFPTVLHYNRVITVTTAERLRCYGFGWQHDLIA